MIIIGCDYHPGFQQIAFVDTDSGEWNERRLGHREEAEQFYRQLSSTASSRCAEKTLSFFLILPGRTNRDSGN